MPDLKTILEGNDLGFFRMAAGLWGIELTAPDAYTAINSLVSAMSNPQLASEVIEALPREARTALQSVWENEGIMPWAQFIRKYGEVREMGAARRDRERPDLNPISVVEALWYRGFIGRHFMYFPPMEPQEYACIPEEFLAVLIPGDSPTGRPVGRLASALESAETIPVSFRILDHSTTLLAALRLGLKPAEIMTSGWNLSVDFLQNLLHAAGLINSRNLPEPESARAFMEAPRLQAMAQLAAAWMNSPTLNDLFYIPGLKFEGEWNNDPYASRIGALDLLSRISQDAWWSLNSFIASAKEIKPDFQRPAGDYDSWFIRRIKDGSLLRGFSSWDEVDGALLRFYITGPLHWLGIFELASPEIGTEPTAFRYSAWASALWHGKAPDVKPLEEESVQVLSDGTLMMTPRAPRAVRYQVARFCEWMEENEDLYTYRLTPASLERASKQGLKVVHLFALLKRHASAALPLVLAQSLEHWEKYGVQSSMGHYSVLRVNTPDILAALQQTRAARYLGDQLNPTTIIVKTGGEEAVRKALADKGYLLDAIKPDGGL